MRVRVRVRAGAAAAMDRASERAGGRVQVGGEGGGRTSACGLDDLGGLLLGLASGEIIEGSACMRRVTRGQLAGLRLGWAEMR